jgi:hypothetical protein
MVVLHYFFFFKLLVNSGIRVGFVWHERSTRVNRHCHTDHEQSVDEGGVTSSPLLCKTSLLPTSLSIQATYTRIYI